MRPDVLTLHRFYTGAFGTAVAEIVSERIGSLWSSRTSGQVVGLGFALPFLTDDDFALMPAAQGVCHWPTTEKSRTALVDEYHLPIADSSVMRLLLVHALEHADRPAHLFREIWRVLAPGGQVIVVTPNRRRTWSAIDSTPFGHGRPYSRSQIFRLMKEQMLPPETWDTALMLPPLQWPGTARLMRVSEKSIHTLGRNLGGVLIVSARKQVYGALPKMKPELQAAPVFTGFRKDKA